MPQAMPDRAEFDILIIGHAGRLQYEAIIFAASLRDQDPDFTGKLIVAEPQPGPMWKDDPRMDDTPRSLLQELGAEIRPFDSLHFGQSYPNGNKIEGLQVLTSGRPFMFFDTDTLVTGSISGLEFDFHRPSASMRREGTWPKVELYGPGYTATWKSLYDRFGLDFERTLDLSQPDEYWQRYLYFNAGWFFGPCASEFHRLFVKYATDIRDAPPEELLCQALYPWLDQIALPLVINALGGGRPGKELEGLDGEITCHYRLFPLLYAREADRVVEVLEDVTAPNRIKKVLKQYEPIKRTIYQGRGQKVRALFDRNDLPRKEQAIRNRIKRHGFWMR